MTGEFKVSMEGSEDSMEVKECKQVKESVDQGFQWD